MSLVIFPVSFIVVAVCMIELAFAVSHVVLPVAFVFGIVRPLLDPVSVAVHTFPLSRVDSSILESVVSSHLERSIFMSNSGSLVAGLGVVVIVGRVDRLERKPVVAFFVTCHHLGPFKRSSDLFDLGQLHVVSLQSHHLVLILDDSFSGVVFEIRIILIVTTARVPHYICV